MDFKRGDAAKASPISIHGLGIADCLAVAIHRVGAERAEVGASIGHADHGQRTRIMFTVEWCRFGNVKDTSIHVGVIGIVEPKTKVEGVGWSEAYVGVYAEDLVDKDSFDGGPEVARCVCL